MPALSDVQLVKWDDMPKENLAKGISRRFIYGEKAMIAQIHVEKGARVPAHHHEHEQISNLISGKLEFRLGQNLEEIKIIQGGEILVIPSDIPHEVIALEDSLVFDIFAPPRQDWIDGTDSYFQDSSENAPK